MLGEHGVLGEDDDVELLDRWIVPKRIRRPPHDALVELVEDALDALLPTGLRTRTQSAITLSHSEPEPGVAVVRGIPRDHVQRHPTPAETPLVVEVADSARQRD